MKKILNSLLLIGILSLLSAGYIKAQVNTPLTSQDSLVPCQAAYEGTWKYEDPVEKKNFIVRLKCLYRLTTEGDTLTKVFGTYALYIEGKKSKVYSVQRKYPDDTNYDSILLSVLPLQNYDELIREHLFVFPNRAMFQQKIMTLMYTIY